MGQQFTETQHIGMCQRGSPRFDEVELISIGCQTLGTKLQQHTDSGRYEEGGNLRCGIVEGTEESIQIAHAVKDVECGTKHHHREYLRQ